MTELERLFENADKAIKECITIPNSWLPEEWHDHTRGCRTLARLERMVDKRDGNTEYRKKKAAKAENVELYRKQLEENGEIDYNGNIDEDQLYRNTMAFCNAHPEIEIDNDDLLEHLYYG